MVRRLWAWLRADIGHVVIAFFVLAVPLYFIGVILFDESTEDGARERAAARVAAGLPASEPPLTGPEQAYVDAMDDVNAGDGDLAVGRAWCTFFTSDRSQSGGWESSTYQRLVAGGEDEYTLSRSWDFASTLLCPGAYRQWSAHMPEVYVGPEDQYNWDPPEADYEREWGPRG